MRTGGPCLPSGRRSVSSCSGGSGDGRVEQRAHLVGHQGRRGSGLALVDPGQRVVDEHDVGVAAVADLAPAVAAHPDDQHPGRQRRAPGPLQLGGRGLQGPGDRGVGDVGQRVADVVDGQAARGCRWPRSGTARGGAGRARRPPPRRRRRSGRRWPGTPRSADRTAGAAARRRRRAGPRRPGPAAAARRRTGCWPAPGPSARRRPTRRAAGAGTRASPPRSSLTRRNPSRPASGSGASANHPSITGSSVRWIAARRLTPEVRASMWFSAPAGSRKPRASRRSRAACGVSRACPLSRRATASSSGR